MVMQTRIYEREIIRGMEEEEELMFNFPFSHLWDSLHQKGNISQLVTPIELILVSLESLRVSLRFAYMVCICRHYIDGYNLV